MSPGNELGNETGRPEAQRAARRGSQRGARQHAVSQLQQLQEKWACFNFFLIFGVENLRSREAQKLGKSRSREAEKLVRSTK